MGIRLEISVSTPLSEEDDQIIAGLGMVMLGLADRNAEQEQPDQEPCGARRDDGQACVRENGHPGRHRYRPINGMVN